MTTATSEKNSSAVEETLYVALELSAKKWRLAMTVGMGRKPRERTVEPGNRLELQRELLRAKRRFGLSAQARVLSCCEAGRDGFWVHRFLQSQGLSNLVVDSSSIQVTRRARRAKADGPDVRQLCVMLLRWHNGEKKVWSVVRVPSEQQEDARHPHRELMSLKRSRTRRQNVVRSLLVLQGVRLQGAVSASLKASLGSLVDWDGKALGERLQARLGRELDHLALLEGQIGGLEAQRERELEQAGSEPMQGVSQLMQLKGIGINSAWIFEHEVFSWRQIRNGKELGDLVGLTPSPCQSGDSHREQGVSKSGIRFVRAVAIEIAWIWVRCQPHSPLTRWYERRFAGAGKRGRKVGIVAVARRLFIELWRFRQTGVLPEGALLKGEQAP